MSLIEKINAAGSDGHLLENTVSNLKNWADVDFLPEWTQDSITELLEKEAWDDRDR